MKRSIVATVLILLAGNAAAQGVKARAFIGYEASSIDDVTTTGFRQNYDVAVGRDLTSTMSVRLQLRADDFRGSSALPTGTMKSGLFQLQPTAQFGLNTATFQMGVVTDYLNSRSRSGGVEFDRGMQRSSTNFMWTPVRNLTLALHGQRMVSFDSVTDNDVNDQWAAGTVEWAWRRMQLSLAERYNGSSDGLLERQVFAHQGSLDYNQTLFGDKLSFSTSGTASINDVNEKVIDGAQEVAVPIGIVRAYFGVDETPSDNRDHPLSPYPGLADGLLDVSTGISLGPSGTSFQNLAADLGRLVAVEEFRIHVRDAAGNPLRTGGGPVTWDVWTSTDGVIWVAAPGATTTFNRTLSRYEVRFSQVTARWFKVVNFGVNTEVTQVTELQIFDLQVFDTRPARSGTDSILMGLGSVQFRPVRRLILSYTASYAGFEQDYDSGSSESTVTDQSGAVEYQISRSLSARGGFAQNRTASTIRAFTADSSNVFDASLRYSPTSRLRFLLEGTRQGQIVNGDPIDTDGLRVLADTLVFPTLSLTVGAGRQVQISPGGERAARLYADAQVMARLTRALRLTMTGSLQSVDSDGSDYASLLGSQRDHRVTGELSWRPGEPLMLNARVGWVSGSASSGLTNRLRAEWYPFAGGSLLLGGSWDQDIDPMSDRRVTRLVINPRWLINRWASLQLDYSSIATEIYNTSSDQKSLLLTLLVTP